MSDKHPPFFVGYLPIPQGLKQWLLLVSALLVAGMAGFGLVMGIAQDDPGPGAFRFDYGRQTVTGVVELTPYPLVRVTEGNERIAPGTTLMLSGQGKSNVDARAIPLEGQLAQVSGIVLQRGTLNMLQLRGGRNGMSAVEGAAPAQSSKPLGRWKLAGEICDGKCLAGAMRPGTGLAHKACANLCLIGGVPPVFVSSKPVDGSEFLLVTGPDGTELPKSLYDQVGEYITIEGEVERRGDLLVFSVDPTTVGEPE
ncbi:hypothetical protein C8N43_1765 [Litoreibacter ponti]|uniref:Uncharacterized protein n=1 Tax=Litoreibacter ponti TaxID=1510457 RepID=A0A2T6BM15_9RHOB|nr:hypothetical protein [Litoreibacter ponti]PTX57099.1 hypothetical protein C8N43_1765 [Litoreibacter ponti]